jgi:hypothetical protein
MTHLQIMSRDRLTATGQSTTSANFVALIPEAVAGKKSIELISLSLPLSMYNIRSGVNNKMDINDGTKVTATITPGNYDSGRLCTEILTQLNTVSSGFLTVSVSATTGLTTITRSSGFTLLVSSGANASTSIYGILGFYGADTASATSQTSTGVMNLSAPTDIFISVLEFGAPGVCTGPNVAKTTYAQDGGTPGFTFTVPVNISLGGVLNWNNLSYFTQKNKLAGAMRFTRVTVRLFYAGGENVDLLNAEWSMTVKIV